MLRSFSWKILVLMAVAGCAPHSVSVVFDVAVPADTPGASVRLIGNAEPFATPGLALARSDDGHFRGEAMLMSGSKLNLSLRLTSPDAAELDAGWAPATHEVTVGQSHHTQALTVAQWDYPADPANPHVTFVVTVPFTTLSIDPIHLTGNHPNIGSWSPTGPRMVKRSDGTYALRRSFPAGTSIIYRITRGSWGTEERGPTGIDTPNPTFTVGSQAATVSHTVVTWRDQAGGSSPRTGTLEYIQNIASAHLTPTRNAIVYLPPGYATDTTRRYSVLYMHDGQNLMDPQTSAFGAEWNVDETAQRLIRNGQIEPIIIVGVYNTSDRIPEYTPVPDPRYSTTARADAYGRFLVEGLKPLIDSRYRTQPEAEHTGVAGSSLGLVSTYFGLTRSATFTRIGAVSPSVWWADEDILTRVNALSAKLPLRVWIDIGTAEGSTPQEEVDNARLLRDAFVAKGWVLGTDLAYLEVPDAQHNERAWEARMDQILLFLYPPVP